MKTKHKNRDNKLSKNPFADTIANKTAYTQNNDEQNQLAHTFFPVPFRDKMHGSSLPCSTGDTQCCCVTVGSGHS